MALDGGGTGRWFLVQLKAGGHERARSNLERQGFESFMPLRNVTRRRAGKLYAAERPLFPGYLFVRLDPTGRSWRSVNATWGVARLVGFGAAGPAEVPAPLMAGLMARTDANGLLLETGSHFRIGERVRVVAGPFADALARIEDIPEQGRIYALLEMMGRDVRAEVSPAHLERI